ncbi:ATP synthase subunit g, mitochondrial [Intoshia linei]|uniref:ATP synthase subunit g, mitochondrial n=1 Tax=Intoshia linei TaxID=1819745 RepID=A0A177B5C2_9BILA|nr:ATP synthase subunit g, mitochondrial [Intoshia linei]
MSTKLINWVKSGMAQKCLIAGAKLSLEKGKIAWKYAKVEFKPPTPGEFAEIQQSFTNFSNGFKTQSWKQIEVKEAVAYTMVAAEMVIIFMMGEIIGKGHVIGYQIPGAVQFEHHL